MVGAGARGVGSSFISPLFSPILLLDSRPGHLAGLWLTRRALRSASTAGSSPGLISRSARSGLVPGRPGYRFPAVSRSHRTRCWRTRSTVYVSATINFYPSPSASVLPAPYGGRSARPGVCIGSRRRGQHPGSLLFMAIRYPSGIPIRSQARLGRRGIAKWVAL